MKFINQNSAVLSLSSALDPSYAVIDGRKEIDRLKFLTDFSSLINFYDQENKINGNWNPFLMKDPVFLTASIAKVNFNKLHNQFLKTCKSLNHLINNPVINDKHQDISISFNQLFNQLLSIFFRIERWSHFMFRFDHKYELKDYLLDKVKTKFSAYFWALISLWENHPINVIVKDIQPIKASWFNNFDQYIWKDSKNQEPFWEVLNIKLDIGVEQSASDAILEQVSLSGIYNSLVGVGDELFTFLHTLVEHAKDAYNSVKVTGSQFPDTVLLRSFVKLLKVQQDQLNEISGNHLQFYFKDILKQSKKPEQADQVFVNAKLSSQNSSFNLPIGSLFNAGLDVNKQPILFETLRNSTLNPAELIGGFTLNQLPSTSEMVSLYKEAVPTPGVLKKDEDGNVVSWDTFGSGTKVKSNIQTMGFSFASPMLLMKEGTRKVTITMTFNSNSIVKENFFKNGSYYLSTKTGWLTIKNDNGTLPSKITSDARNLYFSNPIISPSQTLTFTIILGDAIPAIEKSTKNPDGFDANWSMFKMTFDKFPNSPEDSKIMSPELSTVSITTQVTGVKTFELYNDVSKLSTKAPFPLFGPTPLVNSSFFIGSAEMFSKKLTKLALNFNWDIPKTLNFQNYYQEYNDNLTLITGDNRDVNEKLKNVEKEGNMLLNAIPALKPWQKLLHVLENLKKTFENIFSKAENNQSVPFNNTCFKVGFEFLQNTIWSSFKLIEKTSNPSVPFSNISVMYNEGANSVSSSKPPKVISSNKDFTYGIDESFEPDPSIQFTPLVYTDKSENGFMRMNLVGPTLGFGSSVFGEVISKIALANALELMKKKAATNEPAKVPFIPKVKSLTAAYTASQTYTMDFAQNEKNPIQCYTYTPFGNYQVYDSNAKPSTYVNQVNTTLDNRISEPSTKEPPISHLDYLPLFPSLSNNRMLYLSMKNLVTQSELNLFFKLNRAVGIANSNIFNYQFLTETGWESSDILLDGTKGFTCSGIIKINVPSKVTNKHNTMPSNMYWFGIGGIGKANNVAQTSFLESNGLELTRTGTKYLSDSSAPTIAAETIKKTANPTPEITSVIQTFASFGGLEAENGTLMNQRVSTRLKTKGRVSNSVSYFNMIAQKFPDIYYSKSYYDSTTYKTNVLLVKKFDSVNEAGAFSPLVSECKEKMVHQYVKKNASGLTKFNVQNFELIPVTVTATIVVNNNTGKVEMQNKINAALKLFLSPWITSKGKQLPIDQSISKSQFTSLIKSIEGVFEIEKLSFTIDINSVGGLKVIKNIVRLSGKNIVINNRFQAIVDKIENISPELQKIKKSVKTDIEAIKDHIQNIEKELSKIDKNPSKVFGKQYSTIEKIFKETKKKINDIKQELSTIKKNVKAVDVVEEAVMIIENNISNIEIDALLANQILVTNAKHSITCKYTKND